MTIARPSQISRLSPNDLAAIGGVVRDVLTEEIPKHFARAGLAVGTDADLVAAQQDHAWARRKRLQEISDTANVRKRVIGWGLSILAFLLLVGGAGVLAHAVK